MDRIESQDEKKVPGQQQKSPRGNGTVAAVVEVAAAVAVIVVVVGDVVVAAVAADAKVEAVAEEVEGADDVGPVEDEVVRPGDRERPGEGWSPPERTKAFDPTLKANSIVED